MTLLYGLVLAGGRSRRMGQDKALLERNGQSLLASAAGLLDEVCSEVFVSVREPVASGERSAWPQIADRYGGIGPADGIVSALARFPTRAWLVLACDLPRLSAQTLAVLKEARRPDHDATAFRSGRDDLPEPLCAIYEPSSLTRMQAFLADDVRCPRKMLLNMNTHLLAPAAQDALANANTPEDWAVLAGSAP